MRGAPQRGLAKLISRMSRRTSRGTLGLPARLRDFHRHKMRKPARCQRTIVSGRTMATEPRTDGANRYSQTRIRRSNMLRAGRLGAFPTQHVQLLPKRDYLRLECAPRPE